MPRYSALEQHPHREKLELQLLEGRNVQVISAESGISPSALYRARQELLAERDSHQEATADASRLGAAKRLALLAADARRSRQDAKLTGNRRLEKDLIEVERKLLSDIAALSPELEQTEDAKESEAAAAALVTLLQTFPTAENFRVVLSDLRAHNAPVRLIGAVEHASQTSTKAAA